MCLNSKLNQFPNIQTQTPFKVYPFSDFFCVQEGPEVESEVGICVDFFHLGRQRTFAGRG